MRNIVLITWDSVRADHCSCYGYNKKTTPFLDKLARRGLRFENAIVSGVPTPVSMAGIFTSKHNSEGKIKSKTLAEVLSRNGYMTAAFHSNPYASRYFGFNRGFKYFKDYVWKDEEGYRSGYSGKWRTLAVNFLKKLKLININRARFYYNILCILIKNEYAVGLNLDKFYDDILNFINKNEDKPFFLWILLIETHFPYAPSNWSRWKKAKSMFIYDKYYRFGGVQKKIKLELKDKELKLILDAYDYCIRDADQWTERLWKDLKDADPILIVHADHGDAFGEHGFFGHPPEHYEYLIRVPLIIYNADVKGVVKEPISLLRLAPTICKLAGVKNEFPQPSLLDNVEYTPPIVENKFKQGLRITVRDEKWKLIVNPDREDELYNIKKDPMEQNNLIDDEIDIAKELRALAEKHRKTRLIQGKIGDSVRALKRLKKI